MESEDNVTPLSATQNHVILVRRAPCIGMAAIAHAHHSLCCHAQRLRKGDDEAPWITELVCFQFNAQVRSLRTTLGRTDAVSRSCLLAQGQVLHVTRGNRHPARRSDGSAMFFGDGHVVLKRQTSKEAIEREHLSFTLSSLPASVEAIGCLVTYADDEIARFTRLNDFALTCDLCFHRSGDDDEDDIVTHPDRRPLRVLDLAFDARQQSSQQRSRAQQPQQPNFVVACKFFRNRQNRSEWFFHGISEPGAVRSAINIALTESMQVFLLDIMPDIEIPNRNALISVPSICAALSCDEFLGIESYFPTEGLCKEDFARMLLFELMRARPELMRLARASALVAQLFEMFEQIDINGDAVVDWEEFTTFCISIGLIATGGQKLLGNVSTGFNAVTYHQSLPPANARTFPYQIRTIKSFTPLKRIAVIEVGSAHVLVGFIVSYEHADCC